MKRSLQISISDVFSFCVKLWNASWHSKIAYETVNVCDEFKSALCASYLIQGVSCWTQILDGVLWFPGLLVYCRSSRSAWGTQMHVISMQHELCIQTKTSMCWLCKIYCLLSTLVQWNWYVRIIYCNASVQQSSCPVHAPSGDAHAHSHADVAHNGIISEAYFRYSPNVRWGNLRICTRQYFNQ